MGDTPGHPFHGNQYHSAGEHGSEGPAKPEGAKVEVTAADRRKYLAGSAERERKLLGMSPQRYRMELEKKIARAGRGKNPDMVQVKRVLEQLQAWSAEHLEYKWAPPRRVG